MARKFKKLKANPAYLRQDAAVLDALQRLSLIVAGPRQDEVPLECLSLLSLVRKENDRLIEANSTIALDMVDGHIVTISKAIEGERQGLSGEPKCFIPFRN